MAKVNFNPRSREGSDGMTAGYGMQAAISIHAPARGATFYHSSCHHSRYDFNPRSREGSDLHRFRHVLVVVGISIHAPARGATCQS